MKITRSRGSLSPAPAVPISGQAGIFITAEMNCICSDMVSEAQFKSFTEIEILRYEIEFFREHLVALITSIDWRLTSFEKKTKDASTLDAECMS